MRSEKALSGGLDPTKCPRVSPEGWNRGHNPAALYGPSGNSLSQSLSRNFHAVILKRLLAGLLTH